MASKFNGIYYELKDSVEKLNKEKELAQVEAVDEQLRIVRIEKEKEEVFSHEMKLILFTNIGQVVCRKSMTDKHSGKLPGPRSYILGG